MYQYAAGRALALRLGVDLALDNRLYDACALDVFNIVTVPPDHLPNRQKTLLRRVVHRLTDHQRIVGDIRLGNLRFFNRSVLHAPDGTYLQGYFQDVRYFADHIDTIRKELTPRNLPSAAVRNWLARITAAPFPVSVHVRRGDFVGGRNECGADHYIKRMRSVPGARFFVFSDDSAWCSVNLPYATIVSGNEPHDDLRLMAACQSHIGTPGSSFSDWGGLLQRHYDNAAAIIV